MKSPQEMTPLEAVSGEWHSDLVMLLERLEWRAALDDLPYLDPLDRWGFYLHVTAEAK